MTRLFVRFYLGVLFILFVAWSVQSFVFQQLNAAANLQVIEEALGGGARLAREKLASSVPGKTVEHVEEVQRRFDFPVKLISIDEIPSYARARFAAGDDVVFMGREGGGFLFTPPENGQGALQFGPLPTFEGPSQTAWMTGLGVVMVVAAGAIALLLRPIAGQLQLVERTATAIAGGDFSARVDERKAGSASTMAKAFNNMAGRTETMLRTQRELLQAVSHELRTPLSRIHFAIDLIRHAKDEQEREPRLKSLDQAAEELDQLVGELLGYVRMEAAEPQLDFETVPLRELVEELIEKQSVLQPATRFEIGEQLGRGAFAVRADRVSLRRALRNLMANAGRFAAGRVVIDAHEVADEVVISLDDDGPGIPEADRQRVFDPFVRLDDGSRGAGLGLALVRRIVANHGGSVRAAESPLGGCRIQMIWPEATAQSPARVL